jgi:phospholipid-translocating ATPase
MHLLRRTSDHDSPDDADDTIDPELRLRTVRTAHSTLDESNRLEERAQKRKSMMRKKSRHFFRRGTDKKRQAKAENVVESTEAATTSAPPVTGLRRNIYVNLPLPPDELDSKGEVAVRYVRNKVRTSSECCSSTCFILNKTHVFLARIYYLDVRSEKHI